MTKNKEIMLNIAEDLNHVQYINNQQDQNNQEPVNLEEVIPGYNQMSEQEKLSYQQHKKQQKDFLEEFEGFDYDDDEIQNQQQDEEDQDEGIQNNIDEEDEEQQNQQNNENLQENINVVPVLSEEKNRKIAILSQQIKFEVKKQNMLVSLLGNSQFLILAGLQIWGICIFFIFNFQEQIFSDEIKTCQLSSQCFLLVILLFHVYQYFDFYLGTLIFAMLSPFILLFLVYWGIKTILKKQKNKSISKKLKSVNYKPELIQDESKECTICYSEYELGDKIIFVPCQGKHHFHDNCIREWLKVNPTCPLCRTNFSENPQQQEEDQEHYQDIN